MGKQAIPGAARGQHFFVDPHRVTVVGRDTEHGPGGHPLWDERALRDPDSARVKNIRRYGVKVPVIVRKNGRHEDGPYKGLDVLEVIDGRGRTIDCREAWRLANEAGEVTPQLKVEFERSDEDTQVGIMISLNEHRADDTPMNRARKAGRILASGRSVQDVAGMFGVTVAAVRLWRQLLELSRPVQRAVDNDRISASAALQLRKLSHDDQRKKLAELVSHAKASGKKRPTTNQVRQRANGKNSDLRLNRNLARTLMGDAGNEWRDGLSPECLAVFEWIAGDSKAIERIPGMQKLLEKLTH